MEVSTEKTKMVAFHEKDPVRSGICIYIKVTEQVNCFKYLGYYITHENEKDKRKHSKCQRSKQE
jgi:hypothetical protein